MVEKKRLALLKSFSKHVLNYTAKRDADRVAAIRPRLHDLLTCYPKVQGQLQAALFKRRVDRRLYERTVFEIMSRHHLEETHSNVIAYLLSKPGAGRVFLSSMFGAVVADGSTSDFALDDNCSFQVHREYPLAQKRIDILLEGRDIVVGIENKYYSKLHDTDEGFSQTAFYRQEIERRFKNKRRLYLILDYKGQAAEENYLTLSYEDLLKGLETVREDYRGDRVYEEYLYLLKRIIFGLLNTVYEDMANLSLSQLSAIQRGERQK